MNTIGTPSNIIACDLFIDILEDPRHNKDLRPIMAEVKGNVIDQLISHFEKGSLNHRSTYSVSKLIKKILNDNVDEMPLLSAFHELSAVSPSFEQMNQTTSVQTQLVNSFQDGMISLVTEELPVSHVLSELEKHSIVLNEVLTVLDENSKKDVLLKIQDHFIKMIPDQLFYTKPEIVLKAFMLNQIHLEKLSINSNELSRLKCEFLEKLPLKELKTAYYKSESVRRELQSLFYSLEKIENPDQQVGLTRGHKDEKDERALQIEREEVERLARDRDDELTILDRNIYARLRSMIIGKTALKGPKGVKANAVIDEDLLESLSRGQWWQLALSEEGDAKTVEALHEQYELQKRILDARFEDKVEKVRRGDDLPPGVMKMVKVFIAVKRKLQPGDKMAGRHGNKGVISKVVPMEDMPFLADGTPVDFCLNPLGVPSRMNVGQILETHMGWAARGLGVNIDESLNDYRRSGDLTPVREAMRLAYGDDVYEEGIASMDEDSLLEAAGNVCNGVPIATPVFDGAKEGDVNDALVRAGFDKSGQSILFDGRTGEQFARPVTVGIKYLLKLHHLVDDKIHARSTGPYSLVTQQPLGGKAQFGGQRFGEMEVWALEAYGAAYTLQEMLTVKSDDVAGRTKVYESIVKGEDNFEAGIPESFNVLVKEVRGLGLNMELLDTEDDA